MFLIEREREREWKTYLEGILVASYLVVASYRVVASYLVAASFPVAASFLSEALTSWDEPEQLQTREVACVKVHPSHE